MDTAKSTDSSGLLSDVRSAEWQMSSTTPAEDFEVSFFHSHKEETIVYLLSIFPAVSHTFFLNEVQELRRRGLTIEVASINQPDFPHASMPEAEAKEKA